MDGNITIKNVPKNLISEIKNNGIENFNQKVYRVAKYGTIDMRTFYNTYDEYKSENRLQYLIQKYSLNDIGTYSTSCHNSLVSPKKYIKFLKSRLKELYPNPKIIIGKTICGLSQLSIERDPNYLDETHIDWWIYDLEESCDAIFSAFKVLEEE